MWKKGLVLILLVMLTSGLSAQGMLTEHYQITTLDPARRNGAVFRWEE